MKLRIAISKEDAKLISSRRGQELPRWWCNGHKFDKCGSNRKCY